VVCGGRFSDEVPHEVHVGWLRVLTERKASDRHDDGPPIQLFVDDCDARHPAAFDLVAVPFDGVVQRFVRLSRSRFEIDLFVRRLVTEEPFDWGGYLRCRSPGRGLFCRDNQT